MKPNADMITKILSDLRVNGKVAQDRLLIGKGSDEVLTFGSGNLKVRYTPQVNGGRTFTVLCTSSHPAFDEVVVLKPYPKPSNEFTAMWVLPAEDTIWISDNLTDPDFSTTHMIMYVGRNNAASGEPASVWTIKTIGDGSGEYGLDWDITNTPEFLGTDTNITWSNGEASSYPTSVNDWSVNGAQGLRPEQFSMSNTESSAQKLEYTTDGSTWHSIGEASSEATVVYEPIDFADYDLDSTGKLHIQHNFNNKYVLCLGCIPQPKEVEYLDNELVLDYSDRSRDAYLSKKAEITRAKDPVNVWGGFVWFINSQQSMLWSGREEGN